MIHLADIKVGDYIIHKQHHNSLSNGVIIFYEQKRYKIIDIRKVDEIYILYIDSEVGKYQLLFNVDSYSPSQNRYIFTSQSEERINKIKTLL